MDQFETFEPELVHEMLEVSLKIYSQCFILLNYKMKYLMKIISLKAVFGNDTCSDQIAILKWFSHSIITPCKYFQPMVTIQGACLSFNMLPIAYIFRNPSVM